nr:hypothetical protein [uncultured Fusobacterium sp.]
MVILEFIFWVIVVTYVISWYDKKSESEKLVIRVIVGILILILSLYFLKHFFGISFSQFFKPHLIWKNALS